MNKRPHRRHPSAPIQRRRMESEKDDPCPNIADWNENIIIDRRANVQQGRFREFRAQPGRFAAAVPEPAAASPTIYVSKLALSHLYERVREVRFSLDEGFNQ